MVNDVLPIFNVTVQIHLIYSGHWVKVSVNMSGYIRM